MTSNETNMDQLTWSAQPSQDEDTLDAVKLQQTLALIKPDAYQHQQLIVYRILQEGFTIVHQKSFQFTQDQAALFYREHEHQPFYSTLTEWMASAPVYALILEKEDAIQSWRTLMGPTDANKARATEPTSLRALYGTDGSRNAVHGSDCSTSAQREINLVFDQQREPVTSTNTLAPDNNNAQAPTPATVTAIVDAQPHDLATDEPALPQPSKHDADSDQHHDHSDIHVLESLKVGQPDMLVDQDAMVPHQPADLNGTDNGLSASHESPAPVQRLPDTNQTNDSPVTLHLDVSELDAPAPALTDADVPVSPEPEAQHDTADAVLPVESNTLNEQETIAVDHPSLDHIAHGQVAMDAEPALDLITTSAAPEDAAKDEYSTDVLTEEAVTKEADADATLEPVSTAVVVEASEVKDVNDQYPSEDKMAIVHHDSHDAATQDLTKDESAVEDIMMDTPAVLAEEAPNTQTPKVDDEPVLEASNEPISKDEDVVVESEAAEQVASDKITKEEPLALATSTDPVKEQDTMCDKEESTTTQQMDAVDNPAKDELHHTNGTPQVTHETDLKDDPTVKDTLAADDIPTEDADHAEDAHAHDNVPMAADLKKEEPAPENKEEPVVVVEAVAVDLIKDEPQEVTESEVHDEAFIEKEPTACEDVAMDAPVKEEPLMDNVPTIAEEPVQEDGQAEQVSMDEPVITNDTTSEMAVSEYLDEPSPVNDIAEVATPSEEVITKEDPVSEEAAAPASDNVPEVDEPEQQISPAIQSETDQHADEHPVAAGEEVEQAIEQDQDQDAIEPEVVIPSPEEVPAVVPDGHVPEQAIKDIAQEPVVVVTIDHKEPAAINGQNGPEDANEKSDASPAGTTLPPAQQEPKKIATAKAVKPAEEGAKKLVKKRIPTTTVSPTCKIKPTSSPPSAATPLKKKPATSVSPPVAAGVRKKLPTKTPPTKIATTTSPTRMPVASSSPPAQRLARKSPPSSTAPSTATAPAATKKPLTRKPAAPLPRVATLASKPATKPATEPVKPATKTRAAGTGSSVFSRLSAPGTARRSGTTDKAPSPPPTRRTPATTATPKRPVTSPPPTQKHPIKQTTPASAKTSIARPAAKKPAASNGAVKTVKKPLVKKEAPKKHVEDLEKSTEHLQIQETKAEEATESDKPDEASETEPVSVPEEVEIHEEEPVASVEPASTVDVVEEQAEASLESADTPTESSELAEEEQPEEPVEPAHDESPVPDHLEHEAAKVPSGPFANLRHRFEPEQPSASENATPKTVAASNNVKNLINRFTG